jgi:hypothetical protein
LEEKKRAKIKTHKEVYCVSVDYHQEMDLVAVALVDKVIYLYRAKRVGTVVSFHNMCNFVAKLPAHSMISSISIDRYVTGLPIVIVGTFTGDIRVYEINLDPAFETMTDRQKLD